MPDRTIRPVKPQNAAQGNVVRESGIVVWLINTGFRGFSAIWPVCGKNGSLSEEWPFIDLDDPAVCLMSPRMSPNLNPNTLDDLMGNARHYAEYCMRGTGSLPPTLFLIGSDAKQVMLMPKNLAAVQAKDDFATQSKLMAIACGATVAVMALEAWVKTAKPGEDFDPTEMPSEAFDRQECVVLMGESIAEGQKQKLLPIIRSDNHKFFGFGESTGSELKNIQGRFSQLLPTKIPDEAMRALALAMLKVKGVQHAMSATVQGRSRFRR